MLSSKFPIHQLLGEIGINSTQSFISTQQAGGRRASIQKLADRMGVPHEAAHSLVTNQMTEAKLAGSDIQRITAYLHGALDKPSTQKRGQTGVIAALLEASEGAAHAHLRKAMARSIAGTLKGHLDAIDKWVGEANRHLGDARAATTPAMGKRRMALAKSAQKTAVNRLQTARAQFQDSPAALRRLDDAGSRVESLRQSMGG